MEQNPLVSGIIGDVISTLFDIILYVSISVLCFLSICNFVIKLTTSTSYVMLYIY